MFGQTISPDGKLIAYYHRPPELDARLRLEIISIDGGSPIKVFDAPDASQIRWSPDSKGIDYFETREGVGNLWRIQIDGTQPRKLTDWKQDLIFKFAWSMDGKQLVCARGARVRDIVLIENLNLN